MALTVGTDSYVDVTAADTYFGERLHADQWTGASATDKEKALRLALTILDQIEFEGCRTSDTQLLQWPREGVLDRFHNAVGSATVPEDKSRPPKWKSRSARLYSIRGRQTPIRV